MQFLQEFINLKSDPLPKLVMPHLPGKCENQHAKLFKNKFSCINLLSLEIDIIVHPLGYYILHKISAIRIYILYKFPIRGIYLGAKIKKNSSVGF